LCSSAPRWRRAKSARRVACGAQPADVAASARVRAAAAAACSARDAHRAALTLHAALRPVAPQDYTILNCDDHPDYLRKHKRDPADYRPDILHQARRRGCGRRAAVRRCARR
jgi:hypothetical protein